MKNSLYYVSRFPKRQTKNPGLLVLLHGYGSNELDLFSFAKELPESLLIISLRAPYEMSYGGYAWYEINLTSENNRFTNLPQAKQSLDRIAETIDHLKALYKTNSNKTFLLGFSQGAVLSYALSFNFPNKIQHIIALSGYFDKQLLTSNRDRKKINTDYYISHGSLDQVIPVDWAKKVPRFLDTLTLTNQYSEYPIGHGICPQNFSSFKKWIEERL